jgi:predicted phosphoribosyltransferase
MRLVGGVFPYFLTNEMGVKMDHQYKNIFKLSHLLEKDKVFSDRFHAGKVLSILLQDYLDSDCIVFGIPAGGIPVAKVVSEEIGIPMDVAVVSKITLPWDTEAGYGAVSFNGVVRLNEGLLLHIGLSEVQIKDGIEKTTRKVRHRVDLLRGKKPFPDVSKRPVILVDDGIASGFTLITAIEALKKAGGKSISVAVPTGHLDSVRDISTMVDSVFCPNIRSGNLFSVAAAYKKWRDVGEDEVVSLMKNKK